MFPAVCRRFAARNVVCWIRCAGDMRAMPFSNVHHVILSMPLAVRPEFTALDVKDRRLRAGHMCATLVNDVYHAILSM